MVKKRFLSISALLIVGTILSIAPFFSSINNSQVKIKKSNTKIKSVSQIPSDTNDPSKVNTGVAVVNYGDSNITASEFVNSLNSNYDSLKTYIKIYFYDVVKDPLNDYYIALPGSEQPDYEISNVQVDNSSGKVNFQVTVPNVVVNAQKTQDTKTFDVSVDGFKVISKPTSVKINSNFNFSGYSKGDLINNHSLLLQTFTVENLPLNATYDVEVDMDSILNSPTSFNVFVTVSSYFDENLLFINNSKKFSLTINGVSNSPNTTLTVKEYIDKNYYPFEIDNEMMLSFFETQNLPVDSTASIVENSFQPNNKDGTISYEVKFSEIYYDSILVNGDKYPMTVNVNGFKKATEFSKLKKKKDYLDFKPSDVNAENIADYLDVSTFPDGVTFSGGEFNASNIDGTLVIRNLLASKGFNNDNTFSFSSNYVVPDFTITGLKTQTPSIINVKTTSISSDVLASTLISDDILSNYVSVENLPIDAEIKIENITPNNLNGTLTFSLVISKYYNSLGNLENNYNQSYTITGFKTVEESRVVQKTGIDLSNTHINEINENNVLNYVQLISFPENAHFFGFTFSDQSNSEGSVKFSFSSTAWYDLAGNLHPASNETNTTKIFSIVLTGFATQNPTTIILNNLDNSDNIASDMNTREKIKTLFNISNPSTNEKYPTTWIYSDFHANNLEGTLSFNITINNYYDENGTFRCIDDDEYEPLTQKLSFSNFKIVNKSFLQQKSKPSNILPSDITEYDLRRVYVDTSTFPTNANLKFEITNIRNIDGTLDLYVTANSWYNDEGLLINTPSIFYLKIVGCKTQQPTDVALKKYDVSNILASDVNSFNQLVELVDILNPYGKVVPGQTWTAENFNPRNSEGILNVDIVVNDYFDSLGNPVTKDSNNYTRLVKTITISGFKKTTMSSLTQNNISCDDLYASDINDGNWTKYVNFDSFPSNYKILKTSFSPNNIQGILTIDTTIKNYYDNNGEEKDEIQTFRVVLQGFKLQTLVTNVFAINNNDPNVTTYDALNLYNSNPNEFINKYINVTGAPDSYTVSVNGLIFADKVGGSLTIPINVDKYYDVNGNPKQNLRTNIVVSGFKKIKKSIISQNPDIDFSNEQAEIFVDNFLSLSPSEQENKFKQITVFDSVPNDATFSNFSLESFNNLGEVYISAIASNLYNESGDVVNNQSVNITLTGFKKINSSILVANNFSKNFPATDLSLNVDNFWNFFDKSKFPNDVKVSNIIQTYSNIDGTSSVVATFSKYYGIDGNVLNQETTFSSTISGFKKITQRSQLLQSSNIPNEYFSKSPSELISLDKNLLFNQIVDVSLFPQYNPNLSIEATQFNISTPIADNNSGTISFAATANKYYGGDQNNLINEPNQFFITIGGFKQTPSSFITLKNPHILPSKVTYNDLIFNNFPTVPTSDQVKFTIRDDKTGILEIVINSNYYNIDGVLINDEPFKTTLSIQLLDTSNNTGLIIGLSIGLTVLVLAISGSIGWWIWYKKTHEI